MASSLFSIMMLLAPLLLATASLWALPQAHADVLRMPEPAILPDMLPPADADNINFPSIVAVPAWLRLRGLALGAYYMYFSSHKGSYIRLAYADSLNGPWTLYENGTDLTLARVAALNNDTYDSKGHTASPDVWIDAPTRQLRMYYHFRLLALGHQAAYAYSYDGIHWSLTPGAVHPRPYLRRFVLPGIGGNEYMIDRDVGIYRVAAKETGTGRPTSFVLENDFLFTVLANVSIVNGDSNTGIVRHVGVDLLPNPLVPETMRVYATRIGDSPERVVATRVVLRKCPLCPYLSPSEWSATQAIEVMRPATYYEGADEPDVPSAKGDGPPYRVNQLRDPSPFYDLASGRHYLAYAIGGEFGISIARLTGKDIAA